MPGGSGTASLAGTIVVAGGTLRFSILEAYPELVHGLSTRYRPGGGDWNLSARRGTPQHPPSWASALENRRALGEALGVPLERMVGCQQVHGARVEVVGEQDAGRGMHPDQPAVPDTDGLVTGTAGLHLLALSADCPPVLLYDPVRRAVGIAHSGWKGTVARIAGRAVEKMRDAFASDPADIVAVIGPGVGPCCYAVGDHVVAAALDSFGAGAWRLGSGTGAVLENRDGAVYLNIGEAIRLALLDAGVDARKLSMSQVCTAHNTDVFYSHRGEAGLCGLFGAIIGLRA